MTTTSATTPTDSQLATQLQGGLAELELTLSEQQSQLLLAYLRLFEKWNAAYNLSAVRDPEEMLGRHLLDSLSIVPHLTAGSRWLDVGSGGGLPGIPLAIVYPETAITLLDSNGKKTRFLFQAKTELGLDNVEVVQSRVEAFQPPALFDGIFSRAFSTLATFVEGCQHLLAPSGRFYAMKGQYPRAELRELKKPYNVEACFPLQVPGEKAARHLVVLNKADN